jgi:hypothetical protein
MLFYLVVFGGIAVAGVAFVSAVRAIHKVKSAVQNAAGNGTFSARSSYYDSSAVDSTAIRFVGEERAPEDSAGR